MDFLRMYCTDNVNHARIFVNDACSGKEAWQLISCTFVTTCLASYVYNFFITTEQPFGTLLKKRFFYFVKKLPWINRKIQKELASARRLIESDIHKTDSSGKFFNELPAKGLHMDEVLNQALLYHNMGKCNYAGGMASGAVYADSEDLTELNSRVYQMYCWSNPLHPDLFPGCRKMEAEIVRMACSLFHGEENSCGTVTSGGTESILLACLAYRNLARSKGIRRPEIIAPITAHAAFDKAADMFCMRLVHVPIDNNLKANVKAMSRAICSNTCMLVASCPAFPHGIIDPIEDIAKLGRKHNVPVHVDACLGGFLVCFMDQCGFDLKPFDFRVPGVTSLSADTHKYGFAPKGTSVLLFSDTSFRQHQFFSQPDWPGGIYATPTLSGSRCGANIAACWATLVHMGRNNYVEKTKSIISTARYIKESLHKIDGITVLGEPEVCVVAFTSHAFNIYLLFDEMSAKGWNLNALQFPSALHICVTAKHTKNSVAQRFVNDVKIVAEDLLKNPSKSAGNGMAAIYGSAQSIPDRSLVNEMACVYLNACYSNPPLTK